MTDQEISLARPLRTTLGTELFRYQLTRQWNRSNHPALLTVVMLNPSTADNFRDDPTIRRCMSFANAAGADGLRVVNLFALRSTDPAALKRALDPIGPENDRHLLEAARSSTIMVAAWGAHAFARDRADHVFQLLCDAGMTLQCWGTTKDGHPRHPLYVHGSEALRPWRT